MTGRLMGQAKLAALVTAVAVLAIACASGTTGGDLGSNDSQDNATNTPVATSDANVQENNSDGNENAEPSVPAAEQDITGALFLQLDSPTSADVFVTTDRIEVAGHTTVDALLSINDAVVEVDAEGRFVFAVELTEGPNVVEVVASNAAGEQFDEVLLVMYEPA